MITTTLSKKKLILSLTILVTAFSYAFAQPRKIVQENAPKQDSTQTKEIQVTKNAGPLQNPDKYKIVFVPDYEDKDSRLNKLIDLLNIEGNKGYKLVSAVGSQAFLVKLDESQYEYNWFKTNSSVHFNKNGLKEKLKAASEIGFRIVYHNLLFSYCEPISAAEPYLGENCEYLDFYLLAREKDSRKPINQILVSSFPGWGAKPSVELEADIDKKLAEGFYPVNVFSPFEILLENTRSKEDLLNDKPDVEVVRSGWGRGDVMQKANDLAKQGYRLAMANNRIAVLYRNRETAQMPVSYIRLRADKKNFEKELAKLQKKGAVYNAIYPTAKGTQNTLVFEEKMDETGNETEFKVLKLEFISKENTDEQTVYEDLTPASKEKLKILNELVAQGFEARCMFDTENRKSKDKIRMFEIGILLERRK